MNNRQLTVCMERVVEYFEILSQNLNSETEEECEQFLVRTDIMAGVITNDSVKYYQ
jgi:hypothetical protein